MLSRQPLTWESCTTVPPQNHPYKPAGVSGKATCVLSTRGRSTWPQALLPQLKTGKRHHKQVQKRWLGPKIVYFLLKSFLPKEEYMHSSRDSPADKSRFLVKRSSALNTKETFLGKQEIKTFLQRIKNFWFTFFFFNFFDSFSIDTNHFSFCKSTSWYSFHPVSTLWTTPSATAEPQGLTDYSASCVLSERTEAASSGLAPKHLL